MNIIFLYILIYSVILMIIIIILIIIFIYILWSKNNNKQNIKHIQGFEDYESKSLSCNKNNIIKDRIKDHINDINNYSENINTLHPNGILPYNISNSDDYNILNNYGIKNQRKRAEYTHKINGCTTIPYNSHKLLKNYDAMLDDSFKTIVVPKWENYTAKYFNSNKEELPKILLIQDDNERDVRWSYPQKYLCNRKLYLYYKFDKDSKYSSLLLNNKLDNNEFKLMVSKFKERNIYKLYYNLSKTVKIKVGLKENDKLSVESNSIFIY
jgi:hypothetical protein